MGRSLCMEYRWQINAGPEVAACTSTLFASTADGKIDECLSCIEKVLMLVIN